MLLVYDSDKCEHGKKTGENGEPLVVYGPSVSDLP